jgi:mannose-6-phosphate isomerase-like protein (cupin superfamily)
MSDPAHVPEPIYTVGATEIDMRVLLRASDTGGAISLFEEITPPGKGPPLHIHHNADEFFRVLAGQYRLRVDDRTYDARSGDTIFVPRGTAHCFLNVGGTPGRLFMGFVPGGAEALFDWMAENGMPTGDPDQAAMIMRDFATEFLGPNPLADHS